MSKSVRKHIRKEKARIRREYISAEEQKKYLKELLTKFNSAGKIMGKI